MQEEDMNDEFKGKSGKVKVMYVRGEDDKSARAPNPRTGKGGHAAAARMIIVVHLAPVQNAVRKVVAPRGVAATTLVAAVHRAVTKADVARHAVQTRVQVAATIVAMIAVAPMAAATPHGAPYHARHQQTVLHRLRVISPIMAASAARALLILSRSVVSVTKKPAFMVRTPVRHCSRVVRKRLFAPGSFRK